MTTSLLWLREDLRLDDNPALQAGLQGERLLPLYLFDPRQWQQGELGSRHQGVHRTRLLLESLTALDGALRQRGSQLLVLRGEPEQVIPQLVTGLGLQQVLTHSSIEPGRQAVLQRVRSALADVPLLEFADNGLLRESELPCPISQLPQVFSRFRELCEQRMLVFQPQAAPGELPTLPEGAQALLRPLPSLSQLGFAEPPQVAGTAFPFSGGESAAQARLRDFLWGSQGVRDYSTTRDVLLGSENTSKLSPWLANGSLSVRRVAAELRRHEAQYGRNDSTHALWTELLWRDFFRWLLVRHGSALFQQGGLKATLRAPATVDERFEQWRLGLTGLPFIDANMRELASTGFISRRGRQVVASYLVHGLQQDWRHGAAWFEEQLLDHDPASNWGNWAYIAGVASDPQRHQAFNALRQARQYDPDASYVSHWMPELQAVPAHLRHTPFLLPSLQLDALHYPCLQTVPEHWAPYLPGAA